MILNNAKLYTMSDAGVIENGWLRVIDDKISALGSMTDKDTVPTPDNAEEVIDLDGAWMFPGFIDAHTHVGIVEDSLTFEGEDDNEMTDPVTPNLRAIDAINPMDRCFTEALETGITTVAVSPGSANPIGGQICILSTAGKCVDKMAFSESAAMKLALGENPKSAYHEKSQTPTTRMATAALIRESLYKAREYADNMDKYTQSLDDEDEDDREDKPEYDAKNEALLPVIRGEIPLHIHAHRADDIFTAVRICREFGLKYVLIHGTEAHLIADELSECGVPVISGPFLGDRCKPELANQTFANPGILADAGICVALTTDHPVTPLKYLTLCAAMAVKEGMKPMDAYCAMTKNPAKILGISDKVGTLEVGKRADIAVFDGDPLDIFTRVKSVICGGKRVITK